MTSQARIRSACYLCDGTIEVPAELANEIIPCPHCGKQIKVFAVATRSQASLSAISWNRKQQWLTVAAIGAFALSILMMPVRGKTERIGWPNNTYEYYTEIKQVFEIKANEEIRFDQLAMEWLALAAVYVALWFLFRTTFFEDLLHTAGFGTVPSEKPPIIPPTPPSTGSRSKGVGKALLLAGIGIAGAALVTVIAHFDNTRRIKREAVERIAKLSTRTDDDAVLWQRVARLPFALNSCCDRSREEGLFCTHHCCIEARSYGKVCGPCNPTAQKEEVFGPWNIPLTKLDPKALGVFFVAGSCCQKADAAGEYCSHACCTEARGAG